MDEATYDLGIEESGNEPRRPGLPVEPRRLLLILWPHRKRFGLVFAAAALVALVTFFLLPKTYESSAVLVYEGSPLLATSDDDAPSVEAFVQSAVLPSRLREVRDRLGWPIPLHGLASLVDAEVESKASMRIAASGQTAEDAYTLATTVLDVFLEQEAAFNQRELERLTAENEVALRNARERRDAAQAAFNAFREKSGRPDLLDEREELLQRAATLRARDDEAAVEIAAQSALIEELERARSELPRQVVASAVRGSPVDAPLGQARAELANARSTLSEEHPRVQALKERVQSLQAQRGSEPSVVGEQTLIANPALASVDEQLASARGKLAAAQERKAAVRVLLADIQRETEALAPAEGEARAVTGELDAAIARFELLTTEAAALRDAALSPLTGFQVLSSPMMPEEPVRSKGALAFLVPLPFLVVAVFALLVLLRELRTLNVEAPREVAWWGNGPVLGTTVWPRDPDALPTFVAELEDQGVYGAGRTLVVPATEAERDIACSFAMRLADAPWLAAAILEVGDRARPDSALVTPPPPDQYLTHQPDYARRLSSQGTPSVAHGRAVPHKPTIQGFVPPSDAAPAATPIITPAPESAGGSPQGTSRPPRKRTVIGLPAVRPSPAVVPTPDSTSHSKPSQSGTESAAAPAGPKPFQRKRDAGATMRVIGPATRTDAPTEGAANERSSPEEDAFLLTRSVSVSSEEPSPVGRAVHIRTELPNDEASRAVMRAAVRLLGDDDDTDQVRRSRPPKAGSAQGARGVALAWNGPLSGPVLRRAARLAHRVLVVVSSGLSVVELAQIKTRLGRHDGVGYVLVNLSSAYVDAADRVGPVEEFWQGPRDGDGGDSYRP